MDLLALLYRLMAKSRQQDVLAGTGYRKPERERDFASYPRILADAMMLDFIVDYLRLIISGNMNTFEIEALMDEEIETHESESEVPPTARRWWGLIAGLRYRGGGHGGCSRAGLGGSPGCRAGALIAHAMVGTFLGILLAYGFISRWPAFCVRRARKPPK